MRKYKIPKGTAVSRYTIYRGGRGSGMENLITTKDAYYTTEDIKKYSYDQKWIKFRVPDPYWVAVVVHYDDVRIV